MVKVAAKAKPMKSTKTTKSKTSKTAKATKAAKTIRGSRRVTRALQQGSAVKEPQRPVLTRKKAKDPAKRIKQVGTATLSIEKGTTTEFPIYKAVEGANVIDISKLYASTGHFTFDPGFLSTASCDSDLTYIDGNEGILRYRGYDIADLAKNSDFLEVSYLLLYGDLPNKAQKEWFDYRVIRHTMVHEQINFLYRGFP